MIPAEDAGYKDLAHIFKNELFEIDDILLENHWLIVAAKELFEEAFLVVGVPFFLQFFNSLLFVLVKKFFFVLLLDDTVCGGLEI